MIWGALVGGLLGTVLLTTILRAAGELRLTRMDLPFLLGSAVTPDRVHAKLIGYVLHFVAGLVFALGYWAVFAVTGHSGVVLGALLGRSRAFVWVAARRLDGGEVGSRPQLRLQTGTDDVQHRRVGPGRLRAPVAGPAGDPT